MANDVKILSERYTKMINEMAFGRGADASEVTQGQFITMIKNIDKQNQPTEIKFTSTTDTKTIGVSKVSKVVAELGKSYVRDPNLPPSTREYPYNRESTSIHVHKTSGEIYLSVDVKPQERVEVSYIKYDFDTDKYSKIDNSEEINKIKSGSHQQSPTTRRVFKIGNIVAFEVGGKDYIISDVSDQRKQVLIASGL